MKAVACIAKAVVCIRLKEHIKNDGLRGSAQFDNEINVIPLYRSSNPGGRGDNPLHHSSDRP